MMARERTPQIELHVEELVLSGFPREQRYPIAQALQHELARLHVEGGVSAQLRQMSGVARVDAGSFAVAEGAPPQVIGTALAAAIYAGAKR